MYRIVYISRARLDWSDRALDALGATSSTLNGAHGVTGLLLYDGSRFIQALEGPEDAVRETMRRIAADERHDTIQYLGQGPAAERQFGDWAMQVKRAPDGCCSSEFLARVKRDVDAVEDPQLRAAFIGFAALTPGAPEGYVCAAGQ
jgi:hypothetical protein